MENNVRDKESGDRDGRNATGTTDFAGSTNANGDSLRPDDGNQPSNIERNSDGQIGAKPSNGDVIRSISRDSSVEITDGYYFTPSGNVERIPNGYFINGRGQLAKRRKQRDVGSNATTGNQNNYRNGNETGNSNAQVVAEDFLLNEDKPLNVRGRRKRQVKPKEETTKLALVTMLATGCTALFSSLALLTKHEHWSLHRDEAKHLAEALNDAIATLPSKHYEFILAIIEKWIPWINLIFVIGAITIPRIEASAKRVEKSHYQPRNTSDSRNAGTSDYPAFDETSVGWDQR